MKIENVSENKLEIKTGNLWSIVLGLIFVMIGILVLIIKIVPAWIGIIFVIFGAIAALYSKSLDIILDKDNGKIIVKRKKPFHKTSSVDYNISDLKEFQLRPIEDTSVDGTSYGCLYFLCFKNGQEVSITGSEFIGVGKMFFNSYLAKCRETAAKIAGFLEITLTEKEIEKYGVKETIRDLYK